LTGRALLRYEAMQKRFLGEEKGFLGEGAKRMVCVTKAVERRSVIRFFDGICPYTPKKRLPKLSVYMHLGSIYPFLTGGNSGKSTEHAGMRSASPARPDYRPAALLAKASCERSDLAKNFKIVFTSIKVCVRG